MRKRDWDDEQHERMRDLRWLTGRTLLFGVPFVVATIVAGVLLRDGWTSLLLPASPGLAVIVIGTISNWLYIRRAPFPRLPESLRDRPDLRE
ncbi:hypothetical protein ACIA8G_01690 [Lentzea sp. NPDC051213]|uniref:hypothetical protein n=1 Tax=Lentzea sp. NPDC051213 TaxID=3364126 RepID=UPI0037897345